MGNQRVRDGVCSRHGKKLCEYKLFGHIIARYPIVGLFVRLEIGKRGHEREHQLGG